MSALLHCQARIFFFWPLKTFGIIENRNSQFLPQYSHAHFHCHELFFLICSLSHFSLSMSEEINLVFSLAFVHCAPPLDSFLYLLYYVVFLCAGIPEFKSSSSSFSFLSVRLCLFQSTSAEIILTMSGLNLALCAPAFSSSFTYSTGPACW